MRSTKRFLTVTGVIASAFFGVAALAAQPNPQCVADAAQDNVLCRLTCTAHFQMDKDACRNIDHDCADSCRAGLDICLDGPEGPLTVLEGCRNGCDETLAGAKAICRELYLPDTPERDQCIDQAQGVAFACRDACREGVAAGVQACRRSFRACILACPAPAAQTAR